MNYQDSKIDLVINKLSKRQYDNLILSNMISDEQLYLITDDETTVKWGNISGDIHQQNDLQYALSSKADKSTTLSGYGITDAKISNGTITIGSNSIVPLTSHQSLTAYLKKDGTDSMSGALNMGNNHINNANYVNANWYKINTTITSSVKASEILIKQNGWIYSRTPDQMRSDISAANANDITSFVNLSGKYDDGTEFSFNVLLKQ